MNNNKVYILQKNTPIYKAGQRFERTYGSPPDLYIPVNHTRDPKNQYPGTQAYEVHTVESQPEWFLPEEEVEVLRAKELLESKGYGVLPPYTFGQNKAEIKPYRVYTEDDMHNCFCAGATYAVGVSHGTPNRMAFNDYLKSLNKQ